jgi:RNA polymerase sigma-70 factor (ECF subfamily)
MSSAKIPGGIPMQSDDPALVKAALAGNSAAFASLYDRYAGLVRAVCFESTGSIVDASDLAQDVFLHGYERLAELRNPAHFSSWIVGIARLSGKQWRRTRRRDRHRFFGSSHGIGAADTRTERDDQFDQLHAALMALSKTERTAVHLFYQKEQSAEGARQILGLSLSGFYRVLERARKKLRVRLGRPEVKEMRDDAKR